MKVLKNLGSACVLVALHYCTGADEELILRLCMANGFKPESGMHDHEWMPVSRKLGLRLKAVSVNGETLKRFCASHPTGLYLIGLDGHLMTVDNGVIIDPRMGDKPRRRVLQAWRVTKKNDRKPGE